MNQQENALLTIKTALNSDFKDPSIYMESFRVYLYLEKYADVIVTIEKFLNEFPNSRPPIALGALAIAYNHTDQIEKKDSILAELKQKSRKNAGGSPSFYTAMIYAQMGETDLAFEYLEKAYDAHEVEMYWLKVEPPFEPLHDDPRWQVMLDKVGFPEFENE
jgi:tetratricopeptide (TPR) repeat protein